MKGQDLHSGSLVDHVWNWKEPDGRPSFAATCPLIYFSSFRLLKGVHCHWEVWEQGFVISNALGVEVVLQLGSVLLNLHFLASFALKETLGMMWMPGPPRVLAAEFSAVEICYQRHPVHYEKVPVNLPSLFSYSCVDSLLSLMMKKLLPDDHLSQLIRLALNEQVVKQNLS